MPDYDKTNVHFKGVRKWLGYIMVRVDEDALFLSYGYNEEKFMVLISSCKQALPNIFQGASFKKHNQMLLSGNDDFSKLFFYLPSTTDRKDKIDKFRENVQLYPIDCLYDDFVKYSPKQESFQPQDLDSSDHEKRKVAKEIVLNFFKHAVEVSNSNLMRNVKTLLLKSEIKISDKFSLLGDEKKSEEKFLLTYWNF